MKSAFKILTLFLLVFTFSCGGKKKIARSKKPVEKEQRQQDRRPIVLEENKKSPVERPKEVTKAPVAKTYVDKVAEYIRVYAPIAQEEMKLYKIPASITLAQGILESGAGEGELTLKANNHFGIKCHGWKGGTVYHDDDLRQECFRKYNDPKYSYRDHSLFLTERTRYAALFDLDPNDYKGWAKGLKAAGYATDRKYPDKLISLIERYELYKYDGQVLGLSSVAYSDSNSSSSGTKYVVKQGDTLYSISKKFNLTVEQLKRYNNMEGTAIGIGQVLYVSP